MKAIVPAAAAAVLLLAGAVHAQTTSAQAPQIAPGPPVSALTRNLNSGPPAPAAYLAPSPAPVIAPAVASPLPAATPAPVPRPVPTSGPAAPVATAPASAVQGPAATAPQPRPAPVLTLTPALPVAAPTVASPTTPAPAPLPAAPAVTVLDNAALATLPFTTDLPPGFEIITGRPGPDFRIYTIRRGTQSFVMVYAGPTSQFPIYSGQMVEAGGRASILSTENGVRRAVEHLFQRSTSPTEIHVWTMSLDGADRDIAEQIAQSVDLR